MKDAVILKHETDGELALYFNGEKLPYIVDITLNQDIDMYKAGIATANVTLHVNTTYRTE